MSDATLGHIEGFSGTQSLPGPILPLQASGLLLISGSRTLVDVPSLVIRAGGPTLILGPNGAGKSLLLRILHGLIAPTSGHVLFNGLSPDGNCRRRQAMVFQRPVLLRRSVAANVDFVLRAHGLPSEPRKQRLNDLLDEAGLLPRARQSARTLSGGEQQRLALIRALAMDPEILFLDECTSSLDPEASAQIEALILRAAKRGTKIVMVTHELGQVRRLGAEVVFMHHGQITETTSAEHFLHSPTSEPAQRFVAGGLLL